MFTSYTRAFALGFGLSGVVSAAAFADSSLESRQAANCDVPFHLMIAGGCTLPCSANVPGLLSSLISNITETFPGVDQYFVPYDGSQYQGAVSSTLMIQAANAYVAQCPKTPIVFLGYSLGGIVTTNTLCGGIPFTSNVLASITYGEETQTYPASYDYGTCQTSAPKYARTNPSACEPFAAAMHSYCDAGDPQCCATGLYPLDHFIYPSAYDYDALAFIKARYAAIGGKVSGSAVAPKVYPSMTPYSNVTTTVIVPAPPALSTPVGGGAPVTIEVSKTIVETVPAMTAIYTSTIIPLASVAIPNSIASLSAVVATNPAVVTSISISNTVAAVAASTPAAASSSLKSAVYASPASPASSAAATLAGTASSGLTPFEPTNTLLPFTGAANSFTASGTLIAAGGLFAFLAVM